MSSWRRALVLCGLLLLPLPAGTQIQVPSDPRVPLGDLLEVVIERRQVIVFNTEGGSISADLELGEDVLWNGTQGAVAVVLTNRRVLAVAAISASWQAMRYQRSERPASSAMLGDRVALVATAKRAFGFDGGSGNLVEYSLGPHESMLATSVGANVAVVVTDRSLLGLSPFVGGFFPTPFHLSEELEHISLTPNLATVTTSSRYLSFRADSKIWTERRRTLESSS